MPDTPEQIIANAEKEAKELLAATDKEIADAVASAEAIATKEGQREAEQLKAKVAQYCKVLGDDSQKSLIRAAFLVAENMLQAELKAHPEDVVKVALTALSSVTEASRVWLRANPADVALLTAKKKELIDVLEKASDVDIRADRQVERGGVLIHTDAGVIDAQIKTQLEELLRVLNG